MTRPAMRISATVLGCPDPPALTAFYQRLLNWDPVDDQPTWARLKPLSGGTGLSFQFERDFAPPVWPAQSGAQQMPMHLDIAVEDLDAAVAWACG